MTAIKLAFAFTVLLALLSCLAIVTSDADQIPWRIPREGSPPYTVDTRPIGQTYMDRSESHDFTAFHYGWDFAQRQDAAVYEYLPIEESTLVHCEDDGEAAYNWMYLTGITSGKKYMLRHMARSSIRDCLRNLGFSEDSCQCSYNAGAGQEAMNLPLRNMDEAMAFSPGNEWHLHISVGGDFLEHETHVPHDPVEGYPILGVLWDSENPEINEMHWPSVIHNGTNANAVWAKAWDKMPNPGGYVYEENPPLPPMPGRPANTADVYYTGLWKAEVFDVTLDLVVGGWTLDQNASPMYSPNDILWEDTGGNYWYRVEFDGIPGPASHLLRVRFWDYNDNWVEAETPWAVGLEESIWGLEAEGLGDRIALHWFSDVTGGGYFRYGFGRDGGVSSMVIPGCAYHPDDQEYVDTLTVEDYPITYSFAYILEVRGDDEELQSLPVVIDREELAGLPPVPNPPTEAPQVEIVSIAGGQVTLQVTWGATWSELYWVTWSNGYHGGGVGPTTPPSASYTIAGLADGYPVNGYVCGWNELGSGPPSGSFLSCSAAIPEILATTYAYPHLTVEWTGVEGGVEYKMRYCRVLPDEGLPIETEWHWMCEASFEALPGEKYFAQVKTRNEFGHETPWSDHNTFWTTAPLADVGGDGRSQLSGLAVWPSPTREWVRVSFSAEQQGEFMVDLLDVQGRLLGRRGMRASSSTRVSARVNLEHFMGEMYCSGVFFVRVYGDGLDETRRLVILD